MAIAPLNNTNYSDFFIDAISSSGLKKCTIKRLSGSRVTVKFEDGGETRQCRVILFAVGGSGRGKSLERRVEITSTYAGGNLNSLPGHSDLVIGVDRTGRNMVGIDPRRLQSGGSSHNASSFVYLPAFDRLKATEYFIFTNDRQNLFDREYQIYFSPKFAKNYLREFASLHGAGLRQTPQISVQDSLSDKLEEFSASGSKQKLSYDQQVELALKRMEIGRAGEAFVLERERSRLRSAGRSDLADSVDWTSQTYPYMGYDIKSFDNNGDERFIEVKSSSNILKYFFISENEFKTAKILSTRYRIACVSNALKSASIREIIDPIQRISNGDLISCPITYKIVIKS